MQHDKTNRCGDGAVYYVDDTATGVESKLSYFEFKSRSLPT